MGALKRYNQAAAGTYFTPSDLSSAKSVMIVDPTSAEDETIFFTDSEITVSSIRAVLVGSATPSVTWTVRYNSSRSAAGTEVVTGGTTTTSVTSGSNVTALDSATIPADSWVWLETTAQSGTVTQLDVTVKFGAPVGGGGGTPLDYAAITWTTVPTIDGSDRDIYVSAAGNDSNDGLTTGTPKLTFAAGLALLRDNHGDRLWLRRGDTFSATMSQFQLRGFSTARKMIIGAYGSGARPILNSGTSSFFSSWNNGNQPKHLMFLSVAVTASGYTGGSSISAFEFFASLTDGSDDIIWEDCEVYNFHSGWGTVSGLNAWDTDAAPYYGFGPGRHSNFSVRGCIIHDIWNSATDNYTAGMYVSGMTGILVEWCIFDQASITAAGQYGVHSHDIYFHNNVIDVVYRYNTHTNGLDIQIRCGGEIHHNVSSRAVRAWEFGMGTYPAIQTATGAFEDNVIVAFGNDTATIDCYGVRAGNLNGASIARNIFVGGQATDMKVVWLDAWDGTGTNGLALTSCFVEDNIIHNCGGIGVHCASRGVVGLDWLNNTFKRNKIQSPDNATGWHSGDLNRCINFRPGMSASTWAFENCTLNRNGGTTNLYEYAGPNSTTYSLGSSDWNTNFVDATSTTTAVAYTNLTGATLGHFWVDELGHTDEGTEADNHQALVDALLAQAKATWDDHLTAAAIQFYIATCMTPV